MNLFLRFLFETLKRYFRVDVYGLENIPKRGKALIAPNHSGCSGVDALMLGYLLHDMTPRMPRILTLWSVFRRIPILVPTAEGLGLKAASVENGIHLLRKNNLVVCFPEGEAGSLKPTGERYHLQPFKTGFIRMALTTGSPIIPCIIIGAEEANINLATVELGRKKYRIPLPLNMLPLPAKWDVRFLPPIDLNTYRHCVDDKEKLREIADQIQLQMQKSLNAELERRDYVYLKHA
ncbi:lysophospholipid acyltransferase family protein [Bdellovibrionota bacterium FG-1]